jgi:tRNA (cmo5U34)-methyltransferase
MSEKMEEMRSFFDKRADTYERHMRENVRDSRKYYEAVARLIPDTGCVKILDLGCGTGLELDEIFKVNPQATVMGIDLSKNMLEILERKHFDKLDRLTLIRGSYFEIDFPADSFDIAISVQSMHHFNRNQKLLLYTKILNCLVTEGFYIEADYVVETKLEERKSRESYEKSKDLSNAPDGFYHFDLPFCIDSQEKILKESGFHRVEHHSRFGNTSIFVAHKNSASL